MKRICLFLPFLLLIAAKASAQDYVLLPENFYLHKGDKVNMHLISANQLIKQDETGFNATKFQKFTMGAGKKTTDLMPDIKGKDSVVSVQFVKKGLELLQITTKPVTDDIERDDFLKILDDEGLTQYSEKAKNGSKDSFREKYTWYLKTLVKVDETSGNDFDRSQDQEYEIILKDNPYKGNYGDDIIGLVNFRGKPVANVYVLFYVKAASGDVFVQKLSTDKSGQVYFKLSREGIYMLRSAHIEPSKDKNVDFDTWLATYTFAFESSNTMPNTYKEFGFGNRH
ncbi:MAG: DUF4198 domain-containing protein [Sphingobacteriales bacterium]